MQTQFSIDGSKTSQRNLIFWLSSLVFCVVGWMYSPVLSFDFVHWDDPHNVTSNPLLLKPWSWDLFISFFWGPDSSLRFKPLHWLLYRGWHALVGFDAGAWHFLGLFFHALAAALAVPVFSTFYKRSFPHAKPRVLEFVATLCALLWALHPLRVEPVAWVTGSAYPFTTCFLLGVILFYLKHTQSGTVPHRRFYLAAAWFLALAAYSSYSISLTMSLLLVSFDLGPLRIAPTRWWDPRKNAVLKWWGKHMLFALPALAALAVTLATKTLPPAGFPRAPALGDYTLGERVTTGLASLGWFPIKLLLPFDLTPNLKPMLYREGWDPLASWLMVASTCALLAIWLRRARHPTVWWCACGFVAFSLPCLGLSEFPLWPPDRYSYALDLILIGGAGALLLNYERLWGKWSVRQITASVVMGLILFSSFLSANLLLAWQNTDTLFAHIEKHPDFPLDPAQQGLVYGNWARFAAGNGHDEEATRHATKAVQAYLAGIIQRINNRDLEGAANLVRQQYMNLGFSNLSELPADWWKKQLHPGLEITHVKNQNLPPLDNDLVFLRKLYNAAHRMDPPPTP